MNLFLFCVILLFGLRSISGACNVNLDLINSPILLQKVGNEHVLLPSPRQPKTIDEFSKIMLVCPSGFRDIRDRYNNGRAYLEHKITLECENGELKIQPNNRNTIYNDLVHFSCKNSPNSEIFEAIQSEICQKKYYTVGLNLGISQITFANICFDLDNMRTIFLHYVSTPFTAVLSHQNKENEIGGSTKTEVPVEDFFIEEETAATLIRNLIGPQADIVSYKYEDFYPSDTFHPYISEPLENSKQLNRFLGWRSLTKGNWKSFRNLLKTRSKKFTYDVYLGTSDVVIAPTSEDCHPLKELNLEEDRKVLPVPKYVWTYLKSRNIENDEFVVIGVNSPYFEFFPRNETIFCDDMCHEIDWLAPLEKFRKMSSFGYMFCCRKEQVKSLLEGFPIPMAPIFDQ